MFTKIKTDKTLLKLPLTCKVTKTPEIAKKLSTNVKIKNFIIFFVDSFSGVMHKRRRSHALTDSTADFDSSSQMSDDRELLYDNEQPHSSGLSYRVIDEED